MDALGYTLSSEEHPPRKLVELAQRAEQIGFEFAVMSDHYHPWVSAQGQAPFVWSVLGAVAQATTRLRLGTGVTCPLMRIHPAIIAQAAATAAALAEGRFFLGLGAGENLNEHILGDRWPTPPERHSMLLEAIEIIRELWSGELVSYDGEYYHVDEAKLFTLPDAKPDIYLAASGPQAAELAAEMCDGLIGVAPDEDMIKAFDQQSGGKRPKYAQVTLCWGESEQAARKTLAEIWPQSGLGGNLSWETKTVALFEAAVEPLTEEQIVGKTPCGPDPEVHLETIRTYQKAGYTHIYLHQIGHDQAGFFDFVEKQLMPRL